MGKSQFKKRDRELRMQEKRERKAAKKVKRNAQTNR
jgi:hypothetical protein